MKTDKLLFGAAYYSEYLPYNRVEKDMEMMERAGMNTIRIAESTWSTLEPEDGVFDFTHIDQMLAAAGRHHLSVIIGTPTYAIPAWLAKKYPDILAITKDGQERYGHRQNMDITHPAYLRYAKRIISTLVERVADVPHVIGFQLDNETKSYGTASPRVQQMFVEELKVKYPNLAEFNLAFGLDYWSNRINNWDDFPDVCGTINQSLAAEFQKFQRSLVTRFLSWQADIVRTYARSDQFITQNFDYDWTTYSYGYQPEVNQYEAAKCMTVAGADIYHPSQDLLTGAEITFCGNISRSLKQDNYLILETQAQGNIEWLPYPGQLRLQAYSHIANGSNSVMYWHWHSIHNAIESYWKGVLSHDFSENETYREACRIGSEWQALGSHLCNLKKKNQIAVLLDNQSLTGLSHFPLETTASHSYNSIARWICDALYRMNLEYDMVSSAQRDFSTYSCLIVPGLYSASNELLTAIESYVADGGHLICTFRSGFSDENLKIYADSQPHILHSALGITYNQFTYPKNVSLLGSCVHDWMELITCTTATPVAFYEHPVWNTYPAIAKNCYKKGSTLYLACFFGDAALESVLEDDLTSVGILTKEQTACHFPVIQKTGVNDFGKTVYFYFNYSSVEQTVCFQHEDATELFSQKTYHNKDSFVLLPWNLAILESTENDNYTSH